MFENFQNVTLIMAHPDDEVLWGSSVLKKVDNIVICFGPDARNPTKSAGRKKVEANFPLTNITWLGLEEADVFDGVDWSTAEPTDFGVSCSKDVEQYRTNFEHLMQTLPDFVAPNSLVITHNPWGEYGHADHIQVHLAVKKIAAVADATVWVSSYVSDRNLPYMAKTRHEIGFAHGPFRTDRKLGAQLMELYQENACWTWVDQYEWPEAELFYEILAKNHVGTSNAETRDATPLLNIVRFGERLTSKTDVLNYFQRKILRLFVGKT